MTSTLRRNPAVAALIGLALVALIVVASFQASSLPIIGVGGHTMTAEFSDASGLKVGDRVEIAGVDVGSVTDLKMGHRRVIATFIVDSKARLGVQTGAAIGAGNLLGKKYLEVLPRGGGNIDTKRPIPLARTQPAYDVVAAFGDLTETVEPIDSGELEKALTAVADTFRGSSSDVKAAVSGLSAVSRSIASRDAEVRQLLQRSQTLTASLDGSRVDIATLITEASKFLAEIDQRRETLRALIIHTDELTKQLRGLVQDNKKQIGPALQNLEKVTTLLANRQEQLGKTLHNLAAFTKVFVNTIGSGPWFDSYIANVPDKPVIGRQ